MVGSINCSCFLGNSGFFAIGSGSETLVNDNSITFLSVEATGQKMKGEKHPSIQSRYKIKKVNILILRTIILIYFYCSISYLLLGS